MASLITLTSLLACSLFVPSTSAYSLVHQYDASNWYDSFVYRNEPDPTNGTVEYISLEEAKSSGLTKIINNQVFLGVDNSSIVAAPAGRKSLWLTSKDEFSKGILIGDFAHIPGTACGTWPAFWTIREGHTVTNQTLMPPQGEIDILEYFNNPDNPTITLHSDLAQPGCSFIQNKPFQTGDLVDNRTDCQGSGCSTALPKEAAGDAFNAQGGGVFAMHWTSQFINIYYFGRKNVPSDITAGMPDVSKWGVPVASFDKSRGGCDIDYNFPAQTIYFDTTFCGEEAGGKGWTDWSTCSQTTGVATCEDYMRATPHAYDESYWLINSVKIYQESAC